ncbi:MAG: metal ABC transporter permease [Ruminobacter sp.]|nr:metal ABC transporter permease [Ruminobacter sp.]
MLDLFITPFVEFDFMLNALISLLCLCCSSPIVGVFLSLKKMSLSGDAISHSILPGVTISFLFFGLSVTALTLGGLIAGLIVIILSSLFSRASTTSSDNILTVFYLFSLSLGVLIMSISGSNLDLLNFLFGNIFAINNETILMLGIITSLTLITIFFISRPLIIEIVDPLFFSSVSKIGGLIDIIFMILVVLNLIASFQAIGTLMGIGIMVIPSISLRFWTNNLFKIIIFSVITALLSSYVALIISFNVNISCSPLIIIILSSFFLLSFIIGKRNGIIWNYIKTKHYED